MQCYHLQASVGTASTSHTNCLQTQQSYYFFLSNISFCFPFPYLLKHLASLFAMNCSLQDVTWCDVIHCYSSWAPRHHLSYSCTQGTNLSAGAVNAFITPFPPHTPKNEAHDRNTVVSHIRVGPPPPPARLYLAAVLQFATRHHTPYTIHCNYTEVDICFLPVLHCSLATRPRTHWLWNTVFQFITSREILFKPSFRIHLPPPFVSIKRKWKFRYLERIASDHRINSKINAI
jgi:hypothetical protein